MASALNKPMPVNSAKAKPLAAQGQGGRADMHQRNTTVPTQQNQYGPE